MAYVSFSIMLTLHTLCSWLALLEGNVSCEKSFPTCFAGGTVSPKQKPGAFL